MDDASIDAFVDALQLFGIGYSWAGPMSLAVPYDLDAMRDSGLAHLLSISGLHMAIVGGFVFFATRLGIAAGDLLPLPTIPARSRTC